MATYSYKGSSRYPQNQDNGYRKYPTSQESQVGSNRQGQTTKSRNVSQDLKYRRFLRATYMNLLTGSNSFVFELLDHFGISLDLITAIRNVNSQTATQKDYNMIRSVGLNPEELNLNDLVLNITMNHYLTAEEATNLLAIVKNVMERKQ